ncbi:hypothetical protein NC651_025030 [Populus alba x Populus x berolinensis]|nr:hypothetical protein NC651_025030 [Populus alba x Populus x berolinensis]
MLLTFLLLLNKPWGIETGRRRMELTHIIYKNVLFTAFLFLVLKLSHSLPSTQGKSLPYLTSDVEEVSGKSFDYIVVGGGTAGCPLAATLSERFSVLVIERGGSPYGNPLVSEKMYYGFPLIQPDEFLSVAQSFVSKDGVESHRGRVLGGSSAINGGFYSRASEDFVKTVGWDEELVKEAYEWVESNIVFKPELTIWQSVVELGLLEAGILPYNGFSMEHIEGTKIGGTLFDEYGIRHTSADLLETGNPENIIVLLNATVNNIIFHVNDKGNESMVRGVRFIKSDGSTSQTYEAYLNQPENSSSWGDVILSAGALGSPQILLLSGIGPEKHLRNFGIPLVLDLKGVGKEMKDNPGIALLVDTKPTHRFPDAPQVAGITKDKKFIVEGGIVPISFNATRMPIAIKLAFPESKGTLELNSTDPRRNPAVEFHYLEKEKDLEECTKMVQLLNKIARSRSVVLFLGEEPQNNLMCSQDELRNFCKKNVRTYYHYHGGSTVGSVVDDDYKVHGIKGLRVIDGSTFLESPGTNPMATVLMLGRYQGIKIVRERQNTSVNLRSPCGVGNQNTRDGASINYSWPWACSSFYFSTGNGLPYMTSNVKEVSGKSFDYIIVGGGTAGCPLAATLSEKFSVLLIERGGSPYENPMLLDKKYFGFPFLQTDEFSSVAQRFISRDGVPNLRGRVLGGTSTINAGFYSRASADFIKRVGWDEKLVKEAYEWAESKVVFKPLLTKWNSAVKSGLLEAGILPYNGFSWDHIAGTKIGGTVFDANRKRHISADLLERGNSSNIVVLLNATVKNIVFRSDDKGKRSIVRGIRFIKSNGSINQTYESYLTQPENSSPQGDVILSAGAIGSPQILLLSGIGPKGHLGNFSIPLFLDLKGVGQDMQDNPGITLILRAKPEYRLPESPQVVGIAKDFKFVVEGFVLPVSFNATTLMRLSIKLAFPESKGKLELNNTDPRQNPVVLFNYLAEEKDLRECVQMVQLVKKVARSRSIARFLGGKPLINVTSNPNELRNFCRKNVRTYYHFHGGCSIGSVIDNDYRVIGVKGLRVIDGSTLSESPGTNPMATLLMLGRYQGIKILRERDDASTFGNQQHP